MLQFSRQYFWCSRSHIRFAKGLLFNLSFWVRQLQRPIAMLALVVAWGAGISSQAQTPIVNGRLYVGDINPAGDSESWTFQAQGGEGLMIRVGATNLTPRIRLYAPDNTQIAETTSGNTFARDGFLTLQATNSGTYTILVSASYAAQTGTYGLTLAQSPAAFEVSPGDQGGTLNNGILIGGAIALGDLDMWRFQANAGDSYMVRMGGTDLTPWIRVYGPNGGFVAETKSGNTFARDGVLTLQATNSGSYTVVVSAVYAGQQGEYLLTLAQAPESYTVSAGDQGGILKNGSANTATLSLGDLDMWNFAANAGDSYMLRMGATSATPWIRVYGPDGGFVAETTSGNTFARDGYLNLTATNSGNYTVVVGATYAGQVGDYALTLAQAPASYVVSSGDQGGTLTNGVSNAASLILGDLDVWNFEAQAADNYMLRVGAVEFTPWVRVFGPTGELVGETTSGNTFARDGALSLQATNAGNYTVVVAATYAGQQGTYALTLAQAPEPFTVLSDDQGGALTNGTAGAGTIALGDLDLWSFTAKAGDSAMIRVGGTNFTPWIKVFGPNGGLVGETTSGNTFARDGSVSLQATNSGNYTAVVSATYAGQLGDYKISFAQAPSLIGVGPGDEGGSLTNGWVHFANVDLGDLDVWSFYGTPGDSNLLQVVSTNFTPWIRLYGPDGALVRETTSGNTFARQGSVNLNITNSGIYTLVVSATFAGQTGGYGLREVRVPPDLNVPETQVIDEGTPLNVTISAQDPSEPAKPLVFSILSGPPGAILNPQGSTNATISWATTEVDGPSTNTIVATVTDTVGGKAFTRTNSFVVVVREINVPPQLTVPAEQTLDELTPLAVSASATDADVPANPLTYSFSGPIPEGMTIDSVTGAIAWVPTEAQGPFSNLISVVVTDSSPLAANSQHQSTTNSFRVVVREVNLPPKLTAPPNQQIDELTPLSVKVVGSDVDLPANTLTYSLVAPPQGMQIDPVAGVIAWAPTEAQGPSTNVVTVQVSDGGNPILSATASFTVIVNEVNAPPVFNPVAERSINELTLLEVSSPATDSDVPGNTVNYRLLSAPTGAVVSSQGVISWTPTEAQGPSTNSFILVATDAGVPPLSATNTFTVVVREVNQAPVLASLDPVTIRYGTPISVQANGGDSDVPANKLQYSLEQAPAKMTIDENSGLISWTPEQAQVGSYTVTVRLADGGTPNLTTTATLQITVTGDGSRLAIRYLDSGLIQITVEGEITQEYELQRSVDLVSWQKLVQQTGPTYIDPDSKVDKVRFYRVKFNVQP